jgi:hypothetical protein
MMMSVPMSRSGREALRRRFLPRNVRVLFVGESPPASGRFFYRRDSGLYRAMRKLFETADPSVSDESFLQKFQECGCYLVDLCGEPADKLESNARCAAHVAGERSLRQKISRLEPKLIVSLARSIRPSVCRAATAAYWTGAIIDVPYPGRWIYHRRVFTARLLPVAKRLLRSARACAI